MQETIIIPKILLDKDGYPTDEYLDWIKKYDPLKMKLIDFVEMLRDGWNDSEWGYILRRSRGEYRTLELHTGGWSGNEEIISALQSNYMFWQICFYKHIRGGHYWFRIPLKIKGSKIYES